MTPCFVCKRYPWPHGVLVPVSGCWGAEAAGSAVTHTLCSTCPEGSAVSGIASNQLGLLVPELELYTLMQQLDLNSCTMTEFVENLESLPPLSLSPPLAVICFYFYFPTPSKEVLMHIVHRKETSKSYFSDNQ